MAVLSKPRAIGDILDDLVFDTVQLDAPAWWLHLIFKAIFGDRTVYDEICATCPLTFAEGLHLGPQFSHAALTGLLQISSARQHEGQRLVESLGYLCPHL